MLGRRGSRIGGEHCDGLAVEGPAGDDGDVEEVAGQLLGVDGELVQVEVVVFFVALGLGALQVGLDGDDPMQAFLEVQRFVWHVREAAGARVGGEASGVFNGLDERYNLLVDGGELLVLGVVGGHTVLYHCHLFILSLFVAHLDVPGGLLLGLAVVKGVQIEHGFKLLVPVGERDSDVLCELGEFRNLCVVGEPPESADELLDALASLVQGGEVLVVVGSIVRVAVLGLHVLAQLAYNVTVLPDIVSVGEGTAVDAQYGARLLCLHVLCIEVDPVGDGGEPECGLHSVCQGFVFCVDADIVGVDL